MGPNRDTLYSHIPNSLFAVLKTEFHAATEVYDLFDEFLRHKSYDRAYALKLLERAKGTGLDSWNVRRLATLMLEHQIVNLSAASIEEFDLFFVRLGIKANEGIDSPLKETVLGEGYSTTCLSEFILEFRHKLLRQNRVLNLIQGSRTSVSALRGFIHLSRRECKLSLARYLWSPQEVVELILRRVRLSRGKKDIRPMLHPFAQSEMERTLSTVRGFEAEILRRLCDLSKILWVTDSTSSELNTLVEYPLTTVVLVIKPPGSDLEFEVKRAGAKAEHPLNVFYERRGEPVPPTHRLHAGSMGEYLRWEASAAAILARLYRLIHGTEAPISKTISVSSIYSIPVRGGDEHIVRYFNEPGAFGNGFDRMRQAMADSIAAFKSEKDWTPPPPAKGPIGLTAQFLSLVSPGQALLVGTSSFRLDRVAKYLSPNGPKQYFKEGLGIAYGDLEARWFLEEILDEVLGVYVPPRTAYRDPEQYLDEAFSVPENRLRADRNFVTLMRQIGIFWGTLLALKGFSRGESFVARNVGLKSVWEYGEWVVKIIFMDHDDLDIAGKNTKEFYPRAVFPAIQDDELHIFGGDYCGSHIVGEVEFLRKIYRVGDAKAAEGQAAMFEATRSSFKQTQKALVENAELRTYFHESFIEQILDCDAIAAKYVKARDDASALAAWKEETTTLLKNKEISDWAIKDYFCAFDSFDSFLVKYSFLY